MSEESPVLRAVRSDEVRANLRGFLNAVEYGNEHLVIKRYETPAAVLVPVQWHEDVLAFLRDLDENLLFLGDDLDGRSERRNEAMRLLLGATGYLDRHDPETAEKGNDR